MKKLLILTTGILLFFTTAHLVWASLEVTEIMYAPDTADAEHEWIEVYNNGDSELDLSSWSVGDYDTKWHYHGIESDSLAILGPGSYAIIGQTSTSKFTEFISNFKDEWANESPLFFRASFSLGNNSGRIGLSPDGSAILSDISYTSDLGAKDDGNSLQKINNIWTPALPTPGKANQANNNSTNSSSDTSANTNTSSGFSSSNSTTKSKEPEIPKITTSIIVKKIVFAGLPFLIDSKTIGLNKEILTGGKYFWNFGDGMSRGEKQSQPFLYTYQYPGEYVLTLDYYQYYNYYGNPNPDASNRVTIRVVPSEISISDIGVGSDPYIELENKSSYEIDLSNWVFKNGTKLFTIPKGTILLQGKKIKFSPKITNFNSADLTSISLLEPSGEEAASYPVIKTPEVAKEVKSYNASTMPVRSVSNSIEATKNENIIDLDALGASASGARATPSNQTLAYLGLGVVIILGASGVFLSRQKFFSPRSDLGEGEVEGKIRPEDINIME